MPPDDTISQQYREGYPGVSFDNPALRKNLRFYKNEIKSVPDGDLIEDMHAEVREARAMFALPCHVGCLIMDA